MALNPEQITALRDAFGQIAAPVTDWLLRDAAERISLAGKMTSTASYELYRAKALGESQRALKKYLKRQLKLSNKEIRRLFRQAARMSRDNDEERVGLTGGADLEQMTAAAVKLAQKDFSNLTQTLGMMTPDGQVLPLRQFYQKTMDFAFEQIFTGAADYQTAIRQATTKMADAGVRTIDYESGRSIDIEAAVRRNMMGGMGLLDEQITQANHEALGCNGWEISAHANSAPDHEPYQGRQYSDAEWKKLNGTAQKPGTLKRRIGTLHCGHVAFPIILGVNSPQYTEVQLQAFRDENAKGITYEGRHYTGYEATQKQRQLERAQRKQKRRILVAETNGDTLKEQAAQIRLQMLRQHYKAFSKAAGLPLQEERAWVAGTKRNQSGKVQKLNFAQETTKEDQMNIEQELSLLPQDIREKAETMISEIRVEKGIGGNGYNPKTQEILLSDERESGAVIHEYGHALERALDLRHDPAFIAVRKEGLALEDSAQTVYDRDTFTKPIWRIKSDKFISVYQGRIYPHPKYYIYTPDRKRINDMYLLDYFSEGFRAFYLETELLKQKDPKLYDFIARLSDDKK